MKYRPEIDGLRAVAVLPVVLFHANLPFLDGGFIGVDIFFVISGYLITSIIAEELDGGRFTIGGFYERRARRILPTLFLVLLCTALAAPLFLTPLELEDFGKSVLAVVTFVSNVLFWQQSGYFGTASETSPLLHTWSLAVEEQFYIFFPVLMILLWRYSRHHLWLAFGVIVIGSLALSEWGWRNSAVANFYLLPSRAWELAIGSMVAIAFRQGLFSRLPARAADNLALSGLVAVCVSFVLFDDASPHPSLLTLVPILGTAAILSTASERNLTGRLLAQRPVVLMGLVSYSWYLWHQPMFAFAKASVPETRLQWVLLPLIIVSLVVSYLSWRHFEKPFRDRSQTSRAAIVRFSLIGALVLALIGASIWRFSEPLYAFIHPERFHNYKIIEQATAVKFNQPFDRGCHFLSERFTERFTERFERCARTHGKAVFITGGSHGIDLYNSIARNSDYPFIVSVSRGYCRAHEMLGRRPPHPCHYEDLLEFAARHSGQIESIIYTQTPDRLFPPPFFDAREDDISVRSIDEVVAYLDKLRSVTRARVIMLGMLPPLSKDPDTLLLDKPIPDQLSELRSARNLSLSARVDEVFAAKMHAQSIPYISKIRAMDLDLERDLFYEGALTYSDKRHLSRHGEEILGARLVKYLKGEGLLP
ncbi:MAG: acyltransferase family protein [Gammaproteobacteria bacterium]